MINHGLSTGALFLLVGMLYERRHTRMIQDFGGLARIVPVFTAAFLIVTLSSIGLPGLNGFVGEFLILVGTFRVNVLYAHAGDRGHHPGRGLHALDVPAGDVRPADAEENRGPGRSYGPRDGGPGRRSRP